MIISELNYQLNRVKKIMLDKIEEQKIQPNLLLVNTEVKFLDIDLLIKYISNNRIVNTVFLKIPSWDEWVTVL